MKSRYFITDKYIQAKSKISSKNEARLTSAKSKSSINNNFVCAVDEFKNVRELQVFMDKLNTELEQTRKHNNSLAQNNAKQEKLNNSQQVYCLFWLICLLEFNID